MVESLGGCFQRLLPPIAEECKMVFFSLNCQLYYLTSHSPYGGMSRQEGVTSVPHSRSGLLTIIDAS
jgi:hypothetical protein